MPIDKTIEDVGQKIAKAILEQKALQKALKNKEEANQKMAAMMKTAISEALEENGLSQAQGEELERLIEEKVAERVKKLDEEKAEEIENKAGENKAGENQANENKTGENQAGENQWKPGTIGHKLAEEKSAVGIGHHRSQEVAAKVPGPKVSGPK